MGEMQIILISYHFILGSPQAFKVSGVITKNIQPPHVSLNFPSYPLTTCFLVGFSVATPYTFENIATKVKIPLRHFHLHLHSHPHPSDFSRLEFFRLLTCEQWVPELRHHCPGVPILLVGMKTGTNVFQIDHATLFLEFAFLLSKKLVSYHSPRSQRRCLYNREVSC